jgi:hypothetical protein
MLGVGRKIGFARMQTADPTKQNWRQRCVGHLPHNNLMSVDLSQWIDPEESSLGRNSMKAESRYLFLWTEEAEPNPKLDKLVLRKT